MSNSGVPSMQGTAFACMSSGVTAAASGICLTPWQTGGSTMSLGNGWASHFNQSAAPFYQSGLSLNPTYSSRISVAAINSVNGSQVFDGIVYPSPTATLLQEIKVAQQSIDQFRTLGSNWDGYGASAISPMACDNARYFVALLEAVPIGLPTPELSPTPVGTISFEWEAPHAEAYLEIGNTMYSGFIRVHHDHEPSLLQGYVHCMDQQIISFINTAIAEPLATSAPAITEIQTPWYERLAA